MLSPVTGGRSGAFELLLRYDGEDQTDAPFGGRGTFAMLGANWYLIDRAGFKLNVVRYSAVSRGEIVF
ncbi:MULTISPECIES: porin [unclassified Sphingomonas]|uniref:porin n=1 Tax=unclassified Sphingomonas TaxID=196159 RepID=UPI0012E20D32|nr:MULTISPECIES: porin [unclassified Sphingomonas]